MKEDKTSDFQPILSNVYNNETYTTVLGCIKRRKPWSKMNERKIMTNVPDAEVPDNSISTSKYTLITFFPQNLLEQFSRLANIYFLGVGILQMLPEISNTQQQPLIYVPLFIIIAISMAKDYMEDYKRKKSDREENNREVEVFSNEEGFKIVKWQDLQIGQIIKVKRDEFLPADILLLNSSEPKGVCYIETKNLDGETNLKQKNAHKDLLKVFSKDEDFKERQVWFSYENPNPFLYKFSGNMELSSSEKISVDSRNFILRGCSIRNTQWVIGLVSFTGHDTKVMLNSVRAKAKRSTIERSMNKQILLIFLLQIFICFLCALAYLLYSYDDKDELTYTDVKSNLEKNNIVKVFIIQFGSWVLLLTNFVPISLIVTLEIVKLFQAIILTYDNNMMNPENKIRTNVQSSSLNEELGQIQYIFSDKTGTLTCNIMDFKAICVDGINYGNNASVYLEKADMDKKPKVTNVDFSDRAFFEVLENKSGKYEGIKEALLSLALCHSIIIDEKDSQKIYNSSSPDEIALANFAKLCFFEYYGLDEEQYMLVKTENSIEKFKFLNLLEFNSTRKRMSVIVEDKYGKKILYCKGADSVIIPRIIRRPKKLIDSTMSQLDKYANIGLRTLVVAKKVIDDSFYMEWNEKFKNAAVAIKNREELLEQVNEEIEKEMELVAVTAVEDKLQQDVESTISFIKQAMVQIWVLTGDKLETAINIALSCHLFTENMKRLIIDVKTEEEFTERITEMFEQLKLGCSEVYALVVSGDSLITAMKKPEFSDNLMRIADKCKAVVACRVSPKQKQEIVQLVRKTKPKVITLAIGDGANDVNMITSANVGVGILGKEGAQAARASDFAISEFRFLRRLMFFFGRESYRKNSFLIFFNFYKNVMLVLPHIWFSFFNEFSGQLLYDAWIYQFFNLFYCSLPIIIYALFDEEYPSNLFLDTRGSPPSQLELDPQLYELGYRNHLFNKRKFWTWITLGAWHGALILYISLLSLEINFSHPNGEPSSIFVLGMMIFTECVLIGNLIIINFSHTYHPFSVAIIFASIGFYVSNLYVANTFVSFDCYGVFRNIFGSPNFYLGSMFIILGCNLFEAFSNKIKLCIILPVCNLRDLVIVPYLLLRKELKYSMINAHRTGEEKTENLVISAGMRESKTVEISMKMSEYKKSSSDTSSVTKMMEEIKDLSPIIEKNNHVRQSNIKKTLAIIKN